SMPPAWTGRSKRTRARRTNRQPSLAPAHARPARHPGVERIAEPRLGESASAAGRRLGNGRRARVGGAKRSIASQGPSRRRDAELSHQPELITDPPDFLDLAFADHEDVHFAEFNLTPGRLKPPPGSGMPAAKRDLGDDAIALR